MFSFVPMRQALERIVLFRMRKPSPFRNPRIGDIGLPGLEDSKLEEDSLKRLARFDILKCHCYNPNEEVVLERIIRKVGVEHFNEQIRTLAKAFDRGGQDEVRCLSERAVFLCL